MKAFEKVVIAICLFVSSTSFGWGEIGHQTIGEIAERNLTATAAQSILDILGPERLAHTATWADEVRDDVDFSNFSDYHLVNIPTGFTYATMPDSARHEKDSVTVLKKYSELLRDPQTPRSVKIVALRYLVHIVGDIHQPLHVGNGLDFGGNVCKVIVNSGTQPSNLHSVWDRTFIEADMDRMKALSGSTKKYYRFDDYAGDILNANTLSAAELKKIRGGTYMDWIQESQGLRNSTYPDAKPTDDAKREYCQKNLDPSKIPTLSDSFKKNSMDLARTQLLHSGIRLAELLNQLFSGPSQPGTNVQLTKSAVMKQLDLGN